MTTGLEEVEKTTETRFQRKLCDFGDREVGPTVVCVGSLHGNEPAGVLALERVARRINSLNPHVRGQFVGLAGNLEAIHRHTRYVDYDLNRNWTPQFNDRLRANSTHEFTAVEEREQFELVEALDEVFASARGQVYFIDLHTTSGVGPPFVVLSDTLHNRKLAMHFPVPVVLGLEERIGGTLPGYVSDLGHITMGFEAGQHDEPASVDIAEAAVWTALLTAGSIDPADVPEASHFRQKLADAAKGQPKIVEIRHGHHCRPEDDYTMLPGFFNFQPIAKGTILARDRTGDIVAPVSGRMLLPLYQPQGSDGYFLVRPVRKIWLTLSAILRRLRADALAPLLFGIRKHPDIPNALLVNPRVARWFAVEALHLLGYRRQNRDGTPYVFLRREPSSVRTSHHR